MDNINFWASVSAASVSGLMGYLAARSGRTFTARGQAEASLWQAAPAIIAEQNERIAHLTAEIDKLWTRLHNVMEEEQDCRRRLDALERKQ